LLRHACPSTDKEALTGDLVEKFLRGRSQGWFWRQVLIAIAVGVLTGIRRHWPHFSYAIAGTVMPLFLGKTVYRAMFLVHWWAMPWPLSMTVHELSPAFLLALAALPVLAIALLIDGTFRWISLLRTGMINLVLVALRHYMIDIFPGLLQPAPGNPQYKVLISPVVTILLFFSAFLVSAWLGCLPPRKATAKLLVP